MTVGIGLLVAAYIIGSFPSGLIIGKLFFGKDPRQYGSHNTGATNSYRVFGKAGGSAVLMADLCKGMIGVYLGQMAGQAAGTFPEVYGMILGGLLAIVGHSCSVFLRFKGGKGVATGLGVILFLAPLPTIVVFGIWAIIVAATRLVSLGSIIGAVATPILMYVFGSPYPVIIFGILAAILVIVRHKENIVRLWQGKELEVKRLPKE